MIHRRINVLGLSTLLLVTFVLLGFSRVLPFTHSPIVFWILVWAGFESLINFSGLSWSLKLSNQAFYSWFFGGSLLRLASIGVVAVIVTMQHVAPAAPLISLALAYFLLSLVQIPFLSYGLR